MSDYDLSTSFGHPDPVNALNAVKDTFRRLSLIYGCLADATAVREGQGPAIPMAAAKNFVRLYKQRLWTRGERLPDREIVNALINLRNFEEQLMTILPNALRASTQRGGQP